MNSALSELAALFYDFAVSCGFGFAAGFAWQLVLGKTVKVRRPIAAIIISLLFGAVLFFVAAFFILGRTSARALRWYIAAGLLAGLALWRAGAWRLFAALSGMVTGIALNLFNGLKAIALFPIKLCKRLFAAARRPKKPK